MIPLSLTTTRILVVLGISEKLLFNLTAEMKQVQEEQKKMKDEIKPINFDVFVLAVSDSSISLT